jgi:hypothetical protein
MDVTLDDRIQAMQLGVDPMDWAKWTKEHITLFGHEPKPDIPNRVYCTHPAHQEAARIISGANIAMRFEHVHPKTVTTIDDATIDPAAWEWPKDRGGEVTPQVRVFRGEGDG